MVLKYHFEGQTVSMARLHPLDILLLTQHIMSLCPTKAIPHLFLVSAQVRGRAGVHLAAHQRLLHLGATTGHLPPILHCQPFLQLFHLTRTHKLGTLNSLGLQTMVTEWQNCNQSSFSSPDSLACLWIFETIEDRAVHWLSLGRPLMAATR